MIWFLWEEWHIYVHRFTVFRLLKRREWSNKSARRIDFQNKQLRQHWIADLLNLTAEQLIFVDESLFNETTDWRLRAYTLIDQSARYRVNIIRDRVWSFLSAYTSNDYLLCTDIKESYYNLDSFQQWITNKLLSHCNVYSTSRSVIIMNIVNAHCNSCIREVIETYECRVKYLSFYWSNYNFIELRFSVLKTWMRRHFHESWSHFEETFEKFLKYAMNRNRCNRFIRKHFKYSADAKSDYIFQKNIQALNEQLQRDQIEVE
jgi:hypothetical protein